MRQISSEIPLCSGLRARGRPKLSNCSCLLEPDVRARDRDGKTALMVAAAAGSLEVAKMLVAAGADVNAKSDFGWTALMEAYFEGHPEVAAFLNEVGANLSGFLEGQFLARGRADELRY